MSPSPAASLPIQDRLRGLTAAQKAGQDLLGSLESDRVLDLAAQQLAPDCTAEDLRPMVSTSCLGDTGSPLYFCLPPRPSDCHAPCQRHPGHPG